MQDQYSENLRKKNFVSFESEHSRYIHFSLITEDSQTSLTIKVTKELEHYLTFLFTHRFEFYKMP